jgi:hypothetical protein
VERRIKRRGGKADAGAQSLTVPGTPMLRVSFWQCHSFPLESQFHWDSLATPCSLLSLHFGPSKAEAGCWYYIIPLYQVFPALIDI